MIGSTEIIVVVLIVFVLFGATAIPKFAKSIGEARKEFKKSLAEEGEETKPSNDNSPPN